MSYDDRTDAHRMAASVFGGRGVPFSRVRLTDIHSGETTEASFIQHVVQREADGHFYGWEWEGETIRFLLHGRLWWPAWRRRYLLAKTASGRLVGPFHVEGLERMDWSRFGAA